VILVHVRHYRAVHSSNPTATNTRHDHRGQRRKALLERSILGAAVPITTIAGRSASVTAAARVYRGQDGGPHRKVTVDHQPGLATGNDHCRTVGQLRPVGAHAPHQLDARQGNKTGSDENGNSTAGDAATRAPPADIRASVHGDVCIRACGDHYKRNSTTTVTDDNDV